MSPQVNIATEVNVIPPPMIGMMNLHDYNNTANILGQRFCQKGCGCWKSRTGKSGGPKGVDPDGACPGASSLPPKGGSSLN